jgi:hypothetical protein
MKAIRATLPRIPELPGYKGIELQRIHVNGNYCSITE